MTGVEIRPPMLPTEVIGEGAAAQVVALRLAGAGGGAEAFDVAGDWRHVFAVGVVDDRHHQAAGRGDGDADVIAVVQHDLAGLLVEARN